MEKNVTHQEKRAIEESLTAKLLTSYLLSILPKNRIQPEVKRTLRRESLKVETITDTILKNIDECLIHISDLADRKGKVDTSGKNGRKR